MPANCDPVIDKSSRMGNSCYHCCHFQYPEVGAKHFLRPIPCRINSQTQTDSAGCFAGYFSTNNPALWPRNLSPCYGD